jgi:chromosome segregation ATPase
VTDALSPGHTEPIRPLVSLLVSHPDDATAPSGAQAIDLVVELQGRVAELEMRLRERDEQQQLFSAELHALERDLVIKEAYVKRLEFEQQLLTTEIGQVRARAAELFGDLERAEARIAELGALAQEVQSQPAYRVAVRLSRVVSSRPALQRVARRALSFAARLTR